MAEPGEQNNIDLRDNSLFSLNLFFYTCHKSKVCLKKSAHPDTCT